MRNLCVGKGQSGLRVGGCLVRPRPNLLGDPLGASRAEDMEEAERERYYGVNRQQNLQ